MGMVSKQDVIDAYVRRSAQYFDAKGNKLEYPTGLHGLSGYPKGTRGYNHEQEDKARLGHAKKAWKKDADSFEVRVNADGTANIFKKVEAGHVSAFNVPSSWVKQTLDAELEVTDKVVAAVADVFSGKLRTETYDLARPDEDGFRPSFRKFYGDAVRNAQWTTTGLGEPEAQKAMRQALKALGYKGIRYQGGQTMGGAKHEAYVFWDEQGLLKRRVVR
jgi:hypothetical protein